MSTKPPTLHLEIDAVWVGDAWRIVDSRGEPCQVLSLRAIRSLLPIVQAKPKRQLYLHENDLVREKCNRIAKGFAKSYGYGDDPVKRRCYSIAVGAKSALKDVRSRRFKAHEQTHASIEDRCAYLSRLGTKRAARSRRLSDGIRKRCEHLARNANKRAMRKADW